MENKPTLTKTHERANIGRKTWTLYLHLLINQGVFLRFFFPPFTIEMIFLCVRLLEKDKQFIQNFVHGPGALWPSEASHFMPTQLWKPYLPHVAANSRSFAYGAQDWAGLFSFCSVFYIYFFLVPFSFSFLLFYYFSLPSLFYIFNFFVNSTFFKKHSEFQFFNFWKMFKTPNFVSVLKNVWNFNFLF